MRRVTTLTIRHVYFCHLGKRRRQEQHYCWLRLQVITNLLELLISRCLSRLLPREIWVRFQVHASGSKYGSHEGRDMYDGR